MMNKTVEQGWKEKNGDEKKIENNFLICIFRVTDTMVDQN